MPRDAKTSHPIAEKKVVRGQRRQQTVREGGKNKKEVEDNHTNQQRGATYIHILQ